MPWAGNPAGILTGESPALPCSEGGVAGTLGVIATPPHPGPHRLPAAREEAACQRLSGKTGFPLPLGDKTGAARDTQGLVPGSRFIGETEDPHSHEENGDRSVRPAGVEPATNGLKVQCSTN